MPDRDPVERKHAFREATLEIFRFLMLAILIFALIAFGFSLLFFFGKYLYQAWS